MDLDKLFKLGMLFDFYKELLTPKQREIVSLYYDEDFSLGEISEHLSISRQGVYDTLKRSEKILIDYEQKLQLVERFTERDEKIKLIYDEMVKIKNHINQTEDCKHLIPNIEKIQETCRELL